MFALKERCYAGYRGKDIATPQAICKLEVRIAAVIVACACGVAAERFRIELPHEFYVVGGSVEFL
jgi:hypothetical protein